MDKPYLRHLFEENRTLLKTLSDGVPRIVHTELSKASDQSLNLLIRILYLISVGEISLTEEAAETIKKAKKLKRLFAFESKIYFHKILRSSRKEKLDVLRQFTKIYSSLLYTFFNHTEELQWFKNEKSQSKWVGIIKMDGDLSGQEQRF